MPGETYWSVGLSPPSGPPKDIWDGALGAGSLGWAGTTPGFFILTFFFILALVFFATFFLRAGAARFPRLAFFDFAFLRFFAMIILRSIQQADQCEPATVSGCRSPAPREFGERLGSRSASRPV